MALEPLRPLSAGTLEGLERQTVVDIVGEMVDVNFDRDVILARRDEWVKLFAGAFAPDEWQRLWLEVRRWVYWTQEAGYWLSNLFERGCRAYAPGLRGMALILIAQAEETVADDAAAQATLEHAYAWAQASWPSAGSRPPHLNDFLAQVTNRLRIYNWYYRDTAAPGSIDRHNPLLFTPYHLRTWASLRQTFGCLKSNTWDRASVAELSAVVDSCTGREYDYFRPIARRFLAARLSDDNQAGAAAEQLQLALDDARSYGDGEPAIYVKPVNGMFSAYLQIRVNLNAEVGHLLRLQAETLGALGRLSDAESAAQAATENETFYQSSYWKALSAKRLGNVRFLRGGTADALAAFSEGRRAFDQHMMLTKIPASRSAKQQVIRRYVEGAVAVADLAGQTEALVAEMESAAPVGPGEELGELLVALRGHSVTDMQALRATFYEHLTSVPEDFDDYLRDIPAQREQRYQFRALWEGNRQYVAATALACSSDLAAARLCRTVRPETTAVLHHSGRSGTLFATVKLDGTGESHVVQADWGELDLFELYRRFRNEMAAATSPEGQSSAIRRLMKGANELLSPPMTELLPHMSGRHIKFFPRAQLAAIPLQAISVAGAPLINKCDVSYGTTVRQVTFPREVFDAPPPGNRMTVVHNAANTLYLAGAVAALQALYGDRTETVTNPNAAEALRAIGQVDGDLVVACHGVFNPDHPGDGYLEIGDKPWRLTFDTLFSSVVLRRCRTIILAACTSSVSRAKVAAELVGLPSMLLAAGARYVIGSAWQVNELATSILLTNYLTLAAQGVPPVRAFNQAQRELAATTPDDVSEWCSRNLPALADKVSLSLSVFGDHPFESPEYWAGFGITGDF